MAKSKRKPEDFLLGGKPWSWRNLFFWCVTIWCTIWGLYAFIGIWQSCMLCVTFAGVGLLLGVNVVLSAYVAELKMRVKKLEDKK